MFCGRAAVDGTERANEFHQTCRGNGDGKQAKLTSSNTGSPNGARNLNFKTSSCTGPLDGRRDCCRKPRPALQQPGFSCQIASGLRILARFSLLRKSVVPEC